MKKYKKPELFVETFTMVEHIATGCKVSDNVVVNMHDGSSCSYSDGGLTLFNTDASACAAMTQNPIYDPTFFDDAQGFLDYFKTQQQLVCYNAFIDGFGTFHS